MRVVFSMDGIKNIDQLYTWTSEYSDELGCQDKVEHYHGDKYCNNAIATLPSSDWIEKKYLGSRERIANETFVLTSSDNKNYIVSFAIKTYEQTMARLEVSISSEATPSYDQMLEKLKIALKNTLIPDWLECTWLVDEQAAQLSKEAYEQAFIIENNLRAFASKVLIHFLGVNWLQRAGLDEEVESVKKLKELFVQRVPAFDNINADFLSMTLETLVGIMFKGVVYKEDVVLSHQDYIEIQKICTKAKDANHVANFLKARRSVDKNIWTDLFVPYISSPDDFKKAANAFIENRNHVAHSKVLSWSSYQVILNDFKTMNDLIQLADTKFEQEETSEEVLSTWVVGQNECDNPDYEKAYYRDRLADETGMDILDEDDISDWFDELLHELFSSVYQQYHLDVCFNISDFSPPSEGGVAFTVSCPVDENGGIRLDVTADYLINDDLGEDSTCSIIAKNGEGEEVCKATVCFHNGNGYESDEGYMVADNDTEFDSSELDGFKNELFAAIDDLNPYPAKMNSLAYKSKGAIQYTADFACEQCGKNGVSIIEELLPIGRCCYCGYENELVRCERCGELVSANIIECGLCPACAVYVEKQ